MRGGGLLVDVQCTRAHNQLYIYIYGKSSYKSSLI